MSLLAIITRRPGNIGVTEFITNGVLPFLGTMRKERPLAVEYLKPFGMLFTLLSSTVIESFAIVWIIGIVVRSVVVAAAISSTRDLIVVLRYLTFFFLNFWPPVPVLALVTEMFDSESLDGPTLTGSPENMEDEGALYPKA